MITKKALLMALLRKQWVTVKDSQRHCGLNNLAQRVSEFRAQGIVIRDAWISEGGSRFKAYRAGR